MANVTYDSDLELRLGQVPEGIEDPILYEALQEIHNAIAALAEEIQLIKDQLPPPP